MLWTCAACTTRYAHSLQSCPHCGSPDRVEDGVMPKITKAGGPSHESSVDAPAPDEAAAAPDSATPVTESTPVVESEPVAEVALDPKPARRRKGQA